MEVSGTQVGSLLNAYRLILNGTVSVKSPSVPRELGGYLLSPHHQRRPLGEVRELLRAAIAKCKSLTPTERSVVNLYYGLDLTILPMEASGGPSLSTLLLATATTTGRPRKKQTTHIGARSARYARKTALDKLAKEWTPAPVKGPVPPAREPDPLASDWFHEATKNWPGEQVSSFLLAAIRAARLSAGFHPKIRQEIWLDLDWWMHRGDPRSVAEAPIGRPGTRINSERLARATARMSITIWDGLHKASKFKKSQHNFNQHVNNMIADCDNRAILTPPTEIADLLLINDEIEIAVLATTQLERTMVVGLSDPSAALILSWLEPIVREQADGSLYARATAAISRAAAEHSELNSIALRWFEESLQMNVDPRYIAEAAVNMSAVYSSRRRYRESDWVLKCASEKLAGNSNARSILAVGGSAWRRRLISEAIESMRQGNPVPILAVARECIQFAESAVQLLDPDAELGARLRTEVRLAEALSVATILSSRANTSSAMRHNTFQDTARRSADKVVSRVTKIAMSTPLTPMDKARIDVITDVAQSLHARSPLTQFSIRGRVKKMQELDGR